MDGIFGGKNETVNIRDFQWKTFTPMQLNMDGWGANEKYPHALGEPATSINRMYLKLKSELIPYTYSFAKEAVDGMPLIRAMFLDYPNTYTYGPATQYQFMYGTDFLVAPVYQNTKADEKGNDIRDGIYLPEGTWIDYFTGEKYEGNRILNNFDTPIWKLPVFVKNGSIIPMTHPHNNVSEIDPSLRIYELYPNRHTATVEYDDDGVTEAYRQEKSVSTLIESDVNAKKNNLTITIHPAAGNFDGFVKDKKTELRINVTEKPKKLFAKINGKTVKLTEVNTADDFLKGENVFWYEETPNLNKFATKGSDFEKVTITKNPQVRIRLAATDITGVLTAPQNAQGTEENREAYTLKTTWDKVTNADFYEIEFGGMLYTTIRNTYLLFDGLEAETPYSFKVRAVNKDGVSDWAEIQVTTKANPLEFAIQGIEGESTAPSQGGFGVNRLFDFAESGDNWHTKYRANAIPLDLVIDLKTVNQLDKFHYLPRTDAGNGTILKGSVSYSMDKEHWTEAGAFDWKRDGEVKVFEFANHPTARYIKLNITAGVGNYASGRELYVFKVPGTASYLQGDINNDGKIDRNDLTSYMNYTGLRRGDSDYEGYISKGDINMNDLIDAYDISVVATQLEGGVGRKDTLKVSGSLSISTPKRLYQKDEIVEIRVKGNDLKAVNALSFALPYDQNDYEFVGVESLNMKAMENLTYDRLHTNGMKSLYPTFVNLGKQESLNGSEDLFILKLKAKRKVKFELTLKDGILVDKQLRMHQF